MDVFEKYGIRRGEFAFYGKWEQPLFSAHFWASWYDKSLCQSIGLPPLKGLLIKVNGINVMHQGDLEAMKKTLRKACEAGDSGFFRRLDAVCSRILAEHLELVPLLEKERDAAEAFRKFVDSSHRVMVPWAVSAFLSDYMGELLVEGAEKFGVAPTKAIDLVPKKETIMIRQWREALEIKKALARKGKAALLERIRDHVREYAWVGTHHFWGEPLTVKKFREDLHALKEPPAARAVERKKLAKQLKFLAKAAGEMMFLRQYSAEVFDLVAFKARPVMAKIGKRLGLGYDELLGLTPGEIMRCLNESEKSLRQKAAKRKANYFVVRAGGREIVGDEASEVKALIGAFVPKQDLRARELRGSVACRGRAVGRARIFLRPENFEKMRDGDVLVTTMTTPDFVPLMKKACAIVTDIGGLLSHAALVSREMGKPCIVGTQAATTILKDGDVVEVDANKGVVRKVK